MKRAILAILICTIVCQNTSSAYADVDEAAVDSATREVDRSMMDQVQKHIEMFPKETPGINEDDPDGRGEKIDIETPEGEKNKVPINLSGIGVEEQSDIR